MIWVLLIVFFSEHRVLLIVFFMVPEKYYHLSVKCLFDLKKFGTLDSGVE